MGCSDNKLCFSSLDLNRFPPVKFSRGRRLAPIILVTSSTSNSRISRERERRAFVISSNARLGFAGIRYDAIKLRDGNVIYLRFSPILLSSFFFV